ncbi:hypothetical protein F0562_015737 [Nyssa sinensis]|uniref:Dehydrin n=1 Tax=Nyssa sinensis TaxID=561372 RepID=A0A5J4ZIB3_9ASTE|nr:hypothetical protein F0562_015737 [Nyssa sinensis]
MAGIMNKIGETLHIGGHKEGDKQKDEHKPESHGDQHRPECHVEHKQEQHGEHKPEHKEGGFIDSIKDKIHGDLSTFSTPYRWIKERCEEGY